MKILNTLLKIISLASILVGVLGVFLSLGQMLLSSNINSGDGLSLAVLLIFGALAIFGFFTFFLSQYFKKKLSSNDSYLEENAIDSKFTSFSILSAVIVLALVLLLILINSTN